mgnify:CR=1 FL=1
MTEKEKMLAGKPYSISNDVSLMAERDRAREICHTFNTLAPAKLDEGLEMLGRLFGKIGTGLRILQPFYCDFGYNIRCGDNLSVNRNCVMVDNAPITIGDNVFFGPGCGLYTAAHPLNIPQRNSGLEIAKAIRIGNNVWIGGNAVILPGVSIGDNTVIGAGSIVTLDVTSGVIALGNPCKVHRKIGNHELWDSQKTPSLEAIS